MILGLDLDGVITEAPEFFLVLTRVWPGRVVVITYRDDEPKTAAELAVSGIRYDDLVLVQTFDGKAEVIRAKGVEVYIDDQPEMIRAVPPGVRVLLFRNDGNFDFDSRLWMMGRRAARIM